MLLDRTAGTWVFDADKSTLGTPPAKWVQHVSIHDGRMAIREEIVRPDGVTRVSVDAVPDGAFYAVRGSPIADEIASIEGDQIVGTGRKAGVISIRETLNFCVDGVMMIEIAIEMNGRTIPLGNARFKRQEQV